MYYELSSILFINTYFHNMQQFFILLNIYKNMYLLVKLLQTLLIYYTGHSAHQYVFLTVSAHHMI